jgi:deoxyhypusine synthase
MDQPTQSKPLSRPAGAQKPLDFAWAYPDLPPAQAQQKRALLADPVEPLVPSQTQSVASLVRAFSGMSVQARNLGRCYEVLQNMWRDAERPVVMIGLAGPLIAGGLRQVLRELVEFGLVDVVVSTGAVLYQDIYQARGWKHYQGTTDADDLYIDRIYDTYVDETGFGRTDSWLGTVADAMKPGVYSSRQYLDVVADHLQDEQSLVATCRRRGVPMFAPALNDSSIGIGLTEHHHRSLREGRDCVHIDSIQDNYEITQIVAQAPATAVIYVAGGVPKNWINDSIIMSYLFENRSSGHRYALQVTTAVTADGGLSGSTLDEARSWGKVRKDADRAMAWVEPTVALPLLVAAALQDGLHKGRSHYDFTWNGQLLEKLTAAERAS